MKRFKMIDLVVQIILIVGGTIYALCSINKSGISPFHPYIIVSFWQIISSSVHYFFLTPTIYQRDRINYGRSVLAILVFGYILLMAHLLEAAAAVPLVLIYLAAVLVIFPFLAIFYVVTCWKEYRLMIMKELIHLK